MNNWSFSKFALLALLFFVWTKNTVMDYLYGFLLHFFSPAGAIATITIMCIVAIIFSLPIISKRIKITDYFFLFFIVALFYCNYFIHPANKEVLDDVSHTFLLICIPTYLLGVIIKFSEIDNFLYKISILSILALSFYKFIYSGFEIEANEEDMQSAYSLLPSLLVILSRSIRRPNIFNIFLIIYSILLLFSFGTRGPLVCFIFFVISYIMFLILKRGSIKYFLIILASFSAFFLTLNFFLSAIENIVSRMGMSTRIFFKIEYGELFQSEGRNLIQSLVIDKIIENPILGYGIGADRLFTGIYSHNIILEWCLSFGIPLSIVLFIFLIALIFRSCRCSNIEEFLFSLVLISCSLIMLMISGSYLNSPLLFFLIGYSVSLLRIHKCNKNNKSLAI